MDTLFVDVWVSWTTQPLPNVIQKLARSVLEALSKIATVEFSPKDVSSVISVPVALTQHALVE